MTDNVPSGSESNKELAPMPPSKQDAEKAALLIDKLRLDNDEQRARIVQLQLQWWQRPKAQYALIVPFCAFVGFLATNVTMNAVNQAKLQMQEARIEKQKNEFENQRLEFVQAQLAPRVAQLQQAEEQLITSAFDRYTDVCEIGGRIAAANSVEVASQIFKDFERILTVDAEIEQPIGLIKECLVDSANGERPAELDRIALNAAVLSLSYSCKKTFQRKYARQFPQAVRELTIEIYSEALGVAQALHASIDRSEAMAAVEQFVRLYYGKLVLVESDGVANAMVDANNELLKWSQGPPNRSVLDSLIDTLTRESDQLRKQHTEELDSSVSGNGG